MPCNEYLIYCGKEEIKLELFWADCAFASRIALRFRNERTAIRPRSKALYAAFSRHKSRNESTCARKYRFSFDDGRACSAVREESSAKTGALQSFNSITATAPSVCKRSPVAFARFAGIPGRGAT